MKEGRTMKRVSLLLAVVIGIGSLGVLAATPAGDQTQATKVRVGTYDSRAIAVAYAASKFNPVAEKMKEHERAKKAGDAAKVAELEKWGQSHQRMLHFQGFGRVPVKELLEHVKDGVAKVAADRGLSIITADCDYAAADVEVVDVTDDLVELFNPSDRTREMARKVRDVEPIALTVLADLPADQ
jgi:hypothetical protein